MARASITSLSPEAIAYLSDSDNLFVRSKSTKTSIAMLLGGIFLAALVAALTYDYRWSTTKLAILAAVVLTASFLLLTAIRKLLFGKSGELHPGLIVTGEHTVFVGDDYAEWFPVEGLINADYRHQFNGRNYEFSTLTVTYPATVRKFRVDGIEIVETNVDEIEQRKRDALVRANRSEQMVTVLDSVPSTQGSFRWIPLLSTAVLTLVVGMAGTLAGFQLNDYFHDQLSWQKAVETNSAASFRDYLRTNPAGRYRDDAAGRLKAFYDNAESRYRASLKPGFDQAAVESVFALLRYARETHEHQVKVSFERDVDIPPDLVDRLKEEYEVKTVLPLGNTFTEERMLEREGQLSGISQIAFKQIFPDDVLELVSECPGSCAGINIRYASSFLDSIYYDLKEKDIPREDRKWSPGILIEWTCSIEIPGEPQWYSFKLESAPADEITHDTVETPGTDPKDAEQNSFYDAMVASSFDDFRVHLLFNLGIGPDPHLEVSKTE